MQRSDYDEMALGFAEEAVQLLVHGFVREVTGRGSGREAGLRTWGPPGWVIRLDAYEVYRFWASLDTALFPTGW